MYIGQYVFNIMFCTLFKNLKYLIAMEYLDIKQSTAQGFS
jgi:hypothetical protein